jgi:uncharacterized protein YjbI with pentapeptide repeats
METDFQRANLIEANFNHAQLFYSVRLMEANLMGATFEGVSLDVMEFLKIPLCLTEVF